LSCNKCNTTLLDKVDFRNGQVTKICCNCMNIDPRRPEIINATPLFFNSAIDINKQYPRKLPEEIFPVKTQEEIITKWSPAIQQNIIISKSAKPSFPLLDISEREQVYYKTNTGNITIDWSEVFGYESIKYVIGQALNTKNSKKTHILICGAAGTSKTVFLLTVKESLEKQGVKCHYLDATTMSSSGVIEYLFTNDIDNSIVEIDELDKLKREHQSVFLNMLETGTLQETKNKKIRSKPTNSVLCFATGNYIDKILDPLKTRFMTFEIPKYTKEEFFEIGIKLLQSKKFHKTQENANYIVSNIWDIYTKQNLDPNLRYARQVAELTNNDKKNIDLVLSAIKKYSKSVLVK
jgi:Cdc6-like AAA superfamily ATPase